MLPTNLSSKPPIRFVYCYTQIDSVAEEVELRKSTTDMVSFWFPIPLLKCGMLYYCNSFVLVARRDDIRIPL